MKPVPKVAGASACCTRDRRRAHDPPGHPGHAAAWVQLGLGLWPDADDPLEELVESLADAEAVGFAEVRLRHDYVNGTESSTVGFLEDWYVQPPWQGHAVGRALLAAVQGWARAFGCSELASDSRVEDVQAHAAYRASRKPNVWCISAWCWTRPRPGSRQPWLAMFL